MIDYYSLLIGWVSGGCMVRLSGACRVERWYQMARNSFEYMVERCAADGLTLERDRRDGHPYCLWVNSPSGSKEIWCRNFTEVEAARVELLAIVADETGKGKVAGPALPPLWDVETVSGAAGGVDGRAVVNLRVKCNADTVEAVRAAVAAIPQMAVALTRVACTDPADVSQKAWRRDVLSLVNDALQAVSTR